MALSVVTNVASLRAQRSLSKTTSNLTQSTEKLSSGLRINRAGDDASRSAIASQLSAYHKGLAQAARNANDAVSLLQVAEGGLSEIDGILHRMRELAVQAAQAGTIKTASRRTINQEFQLLESELDRIVDTTEYNSVSPLDGTASAGISLQIGMRNSSDDRTGITISDTGSTDLGINDDHLLRASNAARAITTLDTAIESIATKRASVGATHNRLTMTITNISTMSENNAAALSRIQDVDIAEETAAYTRSQILGQAGIAILGQANSLPNQALALL